jgi:hypothetical protein
LPKPDERKKAKWTAAQQQQAQLLEQRRAEVRDDRFQVGSLKYIKLLL